MDTLSKYRKFIVAGAAALVVVLGRHLGLDNPYVLDVVTILGALGVYQVKND